MTQEAHDRFCSECGVSLDLHYTDDDCEGADTRARLVEAWDRFNFRLATGEAAS